MIRNAVSCLLFLLLPIYSSAQLSQGRKVLVGVNSGLGFTANRSYLIIPKVGYWINERVLVGLTGRFGKAEAPFWGAGAFSRYYFGKGAVLFFPHAELGYEAYQTTNPSEIGALVIRPGAGFRFGRISNRFGAELMADKPLTLNNTVRERGNLKNQISITAGIQFSF